MTLCYFDAFSGISGDMTVGALVDAGADSASLTAALESLGTGASYRFEKTSRRGIGATKFHVEGGEQKAHRHLPQILRMIASASAIPDAAKQAASKVFERLAQSEAKVHNQPLDKVHFHEVGAADSIADIVGACYALNSLGIDAIHCSAINVGSGTVKTEHGILPVPAPATADLLTGRPVYVRGPEVELTTPTGAAIVTALAAGFGAMPPLRIAATGYGAGTKDFPEHANVLRVLIGEATRASESATVSVIEANIDDSSPEVLGYAMDCLFAAGALDVTMEALHMKKNRPGTLLRVIAKPEDQERLAALMMRETSTIGLRIHAAERRVDARRLIDVETTYGTVRMKVTAGGFSPEFEDCKKLAAEHNVPLKSVIAEAAYAYLKEF